MRPTEITEQRLRDALAQRADRTEPADDALDRIVDAATVAGPRDRRRLTVGLVAAAAVLLAVIAVAVLVSGPESESVDVTDDPTSTTSTAPPDPTTIAPPATTEPATSTSTPTTSTTTTAPPTTTTEPPPTTTAPPPVLPGASTDPASGSATGAEITHITDVRIGSGDGYERVVIELREGLPDWQVRYVDPPIRQDGSGEPVSVAGEAFLLVTLTPATAYEVEGETVTPTYPGPGRIAGPGTQVAEVVQVGDYEGYSTWAIGLRTRSPFRVTTLTSPTRLVIDVATP